MPKTPTRREDLATTRRLRNLARQRAAAVRHLQRAIAELDAAHLVMTNYSRATPAGCLFGAVLQGEVYRTAERARNLLRGMQS